MKGEFKTLTHVRLEDGTCLHRGCVEEAIQSRPICGGQMILHYCKRHAQRARGIFGPDVR
jgi:hypothetical protein